MACVDLSTVSRVALTAIRKYEHYRNYLLITFVLILHWFQLSSEKRKFTEFVHCFARARFLFEWVKFVRFFRMFSGALIWKGFKFSRIRNKEINTWNMPEFRIVRRVMRKNWVFGSIAGLSKYCSACIRNMHNMHLRIVCCIYLEYIECRISYAKTCNKVHCFWKEMKQIITHKSLPWDLQIIESTCYVLFTNARLAYRCNNNPYSFSIGDEKPLHSTKALLRSTST